MITGKGELRLASRAHADFVRSKVYPELEALGMRDGKGWTSAQARALFEHVSDAELGRFWDLWKDVVKNPSPGKRHSRFSARLK